VKEFMEHTFARSVSTAERCHRLLGTLDREDVLGIAIVADPDAMASAMALKRIFWRKVRHVEIFHVNPIRRADNLAFVRLLKVGMRPWSRARSTPVTRWAILDSQPDHHEAFAGREFDIIIDHHPPPKQMRARYVDIREDYGANATIMTEYLRALKVRPSSTLATALFYGIKTDTDNFVRDALANDVNAFRYLYRFANMNTVKKIESSEITRHTLDSYRTAMERLVLVRDIAFVHMGEIQETDTLVLIADFFMKMAEASWSIVSGIYKDKLVVILRNAGIRGDAGKAAKRLFGAWGGQAGGHRAAARAEVPLENLPRAKATDEDVGRIILRRLKTAR